MPMELVCRQPCRWSNALTSSSTVAASSNLTERHRGKSRIFSNSRSLVQYQVSPRHSMFLPLLCQVVIVLKVSPPQGGPSHNSIATGWRVGSHLNLSIGTSQSEAPRFSPKLKSVSCAASVLIIPASPLATLTCEANGSDST